MENFYTGDPNVDSLLFVGLMIIIVAIIFGPIFYFQERREREKEKKKQEEYIKRVSQKIADEYRRKKRL